MKFLCIHYKMNTHSHLNLTSEEKKILRRMLIRNAKIYELANDEDGVKFIEKLAQHFFNSEGIRELVEDEMYTQH